MMWPFRKRATRNLKIDPILHCSRIDGVETVETAGFALIEHVLTCHGDQAMKMLGKYPTRSAAEAAMRLLA